MPELTWLDPDELRTVRAFARSTRALFVRFDKELQQKAGVSRTSFEILWLLRHAPKRALRMNDLAEATGSQKSAITQAVSRLEQGGHVRRETCAEDRRGSYAVLTKKGEELLALAAPCYAGIVRRHLLSPLSADQRAQVGEIGEALLEHLHATPLSEEPPSPLAVVRSLR